MDSYLNQATSLQPTQTKFVFLKPIDATGDQEIVRLEKSLLHGFESRTSLQLKNQPPNSLQTTTNGDVIPVYNIWMRKQLLVAFVQTLVTRRLCYSETEVSFAELTAAFEYEGGFHLASASTSSKNASLTAPPRPGIAYRKRRRSIEEALQTVFDSAATAIASWYRLQHGVDFHTRFLSSSLATSNCRPAEFDCTPTRALVKILNPPDRIHEGSGDSLFEISNRKPCWLLSILASFGVLRNELIESGAQTKDDFSSHSFTLLQRKIDNDPCGNFVSVLADGPKCCYKLTFCGLGSKGTNPTTFANDVVNSVLSYGPFQEIQQQTTIQLQQSASSSSSSSASNNQPAQPAQPAPQPAPQPAQPAQQPPMSPVVKFSRALVAVAIRTIKTMPKLASMLTLSEAANGSMSYERKLFEESMKKHSMRIVTWRPTEVSGNSTSSSAILFPPCVKNITHTHSKASTAHCYVVLEFVA